MEGFREDLKPQGTLEEVLVEDLATLFWRKQRCLRAEGAELTIATEFKTVDSVKAQIIEASDVSRADETSGGMLRHTSNRFVIGEAVSVLELYRLVLEKLGFRKKMDPWMLEKLYGFERDNSAPLFSLPRLYEVCSKLATKPPNGNDTSLSADELKELMLGIFDKEIRRLRTLNVSQQVTDKKREEYEATAALVPAENVLDRLIRYEAHLSREIDRTFSRLERLQRIRLGQAVPPPLRLEVS